MMIIISSAFLLLYESLYVLILICLFFSLSLLLHLVCRGKKMLTESLAKG